MVRETLATVDSGMGGAAMNSDFIRIKSLEGELKISQKKTHFGLTVSTKEIVIHKPHINYHIRYEDIVSILPFDTSSFGPMSLVNRQTGGRVEVTRSRWDAGTDMYKVYVRAAAMHNRSGIYPMRAMEFVIPIHAELLETISAYCGLERFG